MSSAAPGEVLGAGETGTGEKLAHFILKHLSGQRENSVTPPSSALPENAVPGSGSNGVLRTQKSSSTLRALAEKRVRQKTKLLFLVGDKTKDSLPSILGEDPNVELDSVPVYETKPSPKLSQSLRDVFSQNKDGQFIV